MKDRTEKRVVAKVKVGKPVKKCREEKELKEESCYDLFTKAFELNFRR